MLVMLMFSNPAIPIPSDPGTVMTVILRRCSGWAVAAMIQPAFVVGSSVAQVPTWAGTKGCFLCGFHLGVSEKKMLCVDWRKLMINLYPFRVPSFQIVNDPKISGMPIHSALDLWTLQTRHLADLPKALWHQGWECLHHRFPESLSIRCLFT